MYRSLISLVLLVGILATVSCQPVPPAANDGEDWTGKLVLFKHNNPTRVRFKADRVFLDGPNSPPEFPVLKVRAVDGDAVELIGQLGWIEKECLIFPEQGVVFFTERIKNEPDAGVWYLRRAFSLIYKGRTEIDLSSLVPLGTETDTALADLSRAILIMPENLAWWNYRGWLRLKRHEYDAALDNFTELIEQAPGSAAGYSGRASILLNTGKLDRAIEDFTKAIDLEPTQIASYINRGAARWQKKDFDKAIADYTKSIELDPKSVSGYFNRAIAWSSKKDYQKALADYSRTLELDPSEGTSLNAIAWIKATCPDSKTRDGKSAVEYANKALALSQIPGYRDTLAAAYAEAGDFNQAIAEARKALEAPLLDEKTRTGYEMRLKLYLANKPYHQD